MVDYIFRRLICIAFFIVTGVMLYSFTFDTDIHFIKYHDIHIISEKPCIRTKNYIDGRISKQMAYDVKWSGLDSDGKRVEFTNRLSDSDDRYKDIKFNHKYKTFNHGLSLGLWLAWLALMAFYYGLVYCEKPSDYNSNERNSINKLLLNVSRRLFIFFGFDSDIVIKFFNSKFNKSDNVIYRDLYTFRTIFKEFLEYKNNLDNQSKKRSFKYY